MGHSDHVLLIDRRPTGPGRAALRAYRKLLPPPGCTPLSAGGAHRSRWSRRSCRRPGGCWRSAAGTGCSALCGPRRIRPLGDRGGHRPEQDRAGPAGGAGLPGADLTFRVAESGAVPAGPWDAIVIVDVLYLQPADAQRALLAEAATRLAAGGLLLVKEMSPAPEWKATWNRWQETVAVSVLGITERMARPRPPSTSSIRRQWPPGCGTRACGRRSGGWTGTDCIRTTS